MSKGQKSRRYGQNAPSGARPAERRPQGPGTYQREAFRPEPAKRSSLGIIIGVLTAISVLLFCYVHLLVLPALGNAYGLTVPELRFLGFSHDQIAEAARALGTEGRENYRWVHRSSGILLPLFLALAWFAMIGQSVETKAVRWSMWAVPMLYAVVYLGGNAAVDAALADPTHGPVALAAVLVVVRWILLLLMIGQAVWMLVRLVRGKLDAFARGELEGQQPLN